MNEKEKEMVRKHRISNWNKTSVLLYSITNAQEAYDILMDEIKFYNRLYHKVRIYQRFNNLRRKVEIKNLEILVKEVEPDSTLVKHLENHIRLNMFFKTKPSLLVAKQLIKTELKGMGRPYITRKVYGYFYRYRSELDKENLGITDVVEEQDDK